MCPLLPDAPVVGEPAKLSDTLDVQANAAKQRDAVFSDTELETGNDLL